MPEDSEKHSRETYYKLAKKQGYRARSAFKLFEIQKKFDIFKRAFYILDLGSAPGSWLQVSKAFAEQNLKEYKDQESHRNYYKIMGVDIKRVSPIENVKIVKMDITNPQFQEEIKNFFDDRLDLILSDASINKSGNKFSDQVRQINLCYKILEIIKIFLKNNGNCVIKAFYGSDLDTFTKKLKSEFRSTYFYKPKSSKKHSNEIYIIGFKKNY
jgi:23S rRNA (uridine2552-2'-O)-methyltransferase